jgi:hypothetical protein
MENNASRQDPTPPVTGDGDPTNRPVDQRSALAALDEIGTVQDARTGRLHTPMWAWHAQGATFLLIGVGLMLPTAGRMIMVFGAAIVGGAVAGAVQRRTGHRPTVRTWKDMIAPLSIIAPVLVIAVVCWCLGAVMNWPWIGVIAGVAAYFAVVIFGPAAERRAVRK